MYVFYVGYGWHRRDFVTGPACTEVARRSQVVYSSHLDGSLGAKRGFEHCSPRRERRSTTRCSLLFSLHSVDRVHTWVYEYFVWEFQVGLEWDRRRVWHASQVFCWDRHWSRGSFANWLFSRQGSNHWWHSWPRARCRNSDDVWHWSSAPAVRCSWEYPKWYEDRNYHSSALSRSCSRSTVLEFRSLPI